MFFTLDQRFSSLVMVRGVLIPFPCVNNSQTLIFKIRIPLSFWFFQRFPQINVGGDSAHFLPRRKTLWPIVKAFSHSHQRVGCDSFVFIILLQQGLCTDNHSMLHIWLFNYSIFIHLKLRLHTISCSFFIYYSLRIKPLILTILLQVENCCFEPLEKWRGFKNTYFTNTLRLKELTKVSYYYHFPLSHHLYINTASQNSKTYENMIILYENAANTLLARTSKIKK